MSVWIRIAQLARHPQVIRLSALVATLLRSAGALLHVARTVCRRAERRVVRLSEIVEVYPGVIEYLNRLSDFLFVLARLVNHREGKQEVQW